MVVGDLGLLNKCKLRHLNWRCLFYKYFDNSYIKSGKPDRVAKGFKDKFLCSVWKTAQITGKIMEDVVGIST